MVGMSQERRRKRRVKWGELFTSDEHTNDEVELDIVEPTPEPIPEEQIEPWADRRKEWRWRGGDN